MNTTKKKPTKDIYLAAAFLAVGAEYDSVDKTDERHMEFYFTPRKVGEHIALSGLEIVTQDLDFIEAQWVNKLLMVNAVEYADAIKRMKSVVHSK